MKCSKSRRLLHGAPPQTPLGSLPRSHRPLVGRGFLPSAIAASRLRRLHCPQFSQISVPQSYIQIYATDCRSSITLSINACNPSDPKSPNCSRRVCLGQLFNELQMLIKQSSTVPIYLYLCISVYVAKSTV